MPIIEIEASRLVSYAITKEVTQQQADAFREAYDNSDNELIEKLLQELIDPRQDVVAAEQYDVMNALIDDHLL